MDKKVQTVLAFNFAPAAGSEEERRWLRFYRNRKSPFVFFSIRNLRTEADTRSSNKWKTTP